jgi:undecaprenyl phosphate-alpha-L-ara4FN deformylase
MGPDNMGRHVWRLFRPAFLAKMLRSRAPSLYGWDILLRGVFWPGPIIGSLAEPANRNASQRGHEIGFHAWDHHAWQRHIDTISFQRISADMEKGIEMLEQASGVKPTCSAAPAWQCTESALLAKASYAFRFNSDCRGRSVFRPKVDGRTLEQPQIPCTLPTYDEVVGRNGIDDSNYNTYILSCIVPDRLNVLTIHAEVEGGARIEMFRTFLEAAARRGVTVSPLGDCLADWPAPPACPIVQGSIEGREGWISIQGEEV